jgi:hypothetical protein
MAHFAELESKTDPTGFTSDTHLVVKRVVVVGNDCVPSDEHVDGETWCVNFFGGGTWKQTSYNHNFRKQYAGIGYVYNESKNKFIAPQPYASWSLDGSDEWQAPVAYPDKDVADYMISWDEDNTRWNGTKISDDSKHRWNADTKAWVAL